MKLFSFFALTVIVLLGCEYGVVTKPKTSADSEKEDSLLTQSIITKSENGYWLVVRGYKFTDHMVAAATLTDYSHAAIVDIKRKSVIEADATGIHETSLAKFVNHSYRITIVKPFGYTTTRGELAVVSARDKIGKPYDFLGLFGINEKERYYCSELAACCYPNLKDSIKLPRIIKPSYLLQLGTTIHETKERKVK